MSSYYHKFQWDKTIILDIERNYKKRLISEMFINTFDNTLNKIEDTHKLIICINVLNYFQIDDALKIPDKFLVLTF